MKDSLRYEVGEIVEKAVERAIAVHVNEISHRYTEKFSMGLKEDDVSLGAAIRAILERLSLELVVEPRVPAIPAKVVAKKVVAK